MNLFQRAITSRWRWLVHGMPSPARAAALFHARRATMTTPHRCRLLWNQCIDVFRRGVPGCLVECGVWRGGSAAVMALAARHTGQARMLHLFDSFEGLPEPTAEDETPAADYSGGRVSGRLASINQCKASKHEVEEFLIRRLGFDPATVHFHAGWFQETIPSDSETLGPIAVLRLDGDWYESTKICLDHLYPKLSRGGVLVLDDYYAWAGCRKATEEYRAMHTIREPIMRIDLDAAYWIRE